MLVFYQVLFWWFGLQQSYLPLLRVICSGGLLKSELRTNIKGSISNSRDDTSGLHGNRHKHTWSCFYFGPSER